MNAKHAASTVAPSDLKNGSGSSRNVTDKLPDLKPEPFSINMVEPVSGKTIRAATHIELKWVFASSTNVLFAVLDVGLSLCCLFIMFRLHRFLPLLTPLFEPSSMLLVFVGLGYTGMCSHTIGTVLCYFARKRKFQAALKKFLGIFCFWSALLGGVQACCYFSVNWYAKETAHFYKSGFLLKIPDYMNDTRVAYVIDDLQNQLGCCGTKDYRDWLKTLWQPFDELDEITIPSTCCQNSVCLTKVTRSSVDEMTYNTKSCSLALREYYMGYFTIVGYVVAAMAALEGFTFIITMCLVAIIAPVTNETLGRSGRMGSGTSKSIRKARRKSDKYRRKSKYNKTKLERRSDRLKRRESRRASRLNDSAPGQRDKVHVGLPGKPEGLKVVAGVNDTKAEAAVKVNAGKVNDQTVVPRRKTGILKTRVGSLKERAKNFKAKFKDKAGRSKSKGKTTAVAPVSK